MTNDEFMVSFRMRFVWGVLLLLAALGSAQAQTTTPTTQPVSSVSVWLGELADGDDAVREQARAQLLGISRDQLLELKDAVRQAMPLERSQLAALKEIVIHVYLAGETYDSKPQEGFIGITGVIGNMGQPAVGGVLIQDGQLIPGFCGYQVLQTGDVICGVAEYPRIQIQSTENLRQALSQDAGQTMHLEVLRRGQMIVVPITLDPRPAWASEGTPNRDELLHERLVKAEEYWQRVFAPLLEEGVS